MCYTLNTDEGRNLMRTIWISDRMIEPLGQVCAARSEYGLLAVSFPSSPSTLSARLAEKYRNVEIEIAEDPFFDKLFGQIGEYVHGQRTKIDVAIDPDAVTGFQKQALEATSRVNYGTTASYKQIALMLARPNAARAVGRAEATNPIPLVIPCHRVIGSDGRLHGYGAGNGVATKQWLLELEQRVKENKG